MCIPEQKISPEEPLTDNPTSDEIADMVLRGEIDMSTWRFVDDSRLSGAFLDIISILVSNRYDPHLTGLENRSELLCLIENNIIETIKFWAEMEASDKEGMKVLL